MLQCPAHSLAFCVCVLFCCSLNDSLDTREYHKPIFVYVTCFSRLLRGFVVSANLRNTLSSFYDDKWQSLQISVILREYFAEIAQNNVEIQAREIP